MSPSITWKDGGPLMTQGGLIGGSDKCCCENPPPPWCGCGDFCQYFIEVVSPSQVAAKTKAFDCLATELVSGKNAARDAFWLDSVVIPAGFEVPTADCLISLGFSNEEIFGNSSSLVGAGGYGLYAGVGLHAYYYTAPCSLPTLRIAAGITVRFSCQEKSGADLVDPYIELSLGVDGLKSYRLSNGNVLGWESYFRIEKTLLIYPDTECYYGNQMTCLPGVGKKIIHTPMLIEANSTSTTFGEWSYNGVYSGGTDSGMLETICNQVLSEMSATFRITSRPNCKPPVACNCDVPIYGLVFTMDEAQFQLNDTGGTYTVTSGQYVKVWTYVSYGISGFQVTYEKWDEFFTQRYERKTVQVFCAAESLSSSVRRYYAYISDECFGYDNNGFLTQWSYENYTGQFGCSPATLNWYSSRSIGDAIPTGEVQDLVLTGSGNEPGGYGACSVPAVPVISINEPGY